MALKLKHLRLMLSINFPVRRFLPVALLAAGTIASAQYVDDFDTEALFTRKLIEKRMYDFAERQLNFVSSNFKSERDQINILYGRYHGARGKRSKAVEYLKKVPNSSAYYSGACLARALVASKPEDKAAGFAAYLESLGPPPLKNTKNADEFTNAMVRYAEALKRLNQPAKAEAIIKLIPKYLPKSGFDDRMAEFLGLQAKLAAVDILVDKKRPLSEYEADVNAALKTIEGMMWHEPDLITALAYTEFGHACVLLKQPDKAIKTLNDVADYLNNIEEALDKEYGSVCGSPLAPAYYYLGEALMEKGRTARDSSNKGNAQRHLLKALQQYYKCSSKRYKCAPIYDKASQKVMLVKDILVDKFGVNQDKLNAKFPPTNEQAVKIAAGHAEYKLQQYSRALPHYLEGARLSLHNHQATEAFLFAAICYYKTDHYLEAAACADFMAERYPNDKYTWDALFNVATILRVRSNEFRQADVALSDRYNGYSALLMGRFVKLAPDHPKAPTAANTTAESQYARGSRLSKEKRILVQSGKSPDEIKAHVLKMREEYLSAVPLYEVLTEEYGGTKEGIKALYRLGWIYHINDDSENAYTYFLRYCEVQQEPVREKYESKFLAARRLMLLDRIDDAMEHFEEFLAWTKPGTPYHQTEHLGTYRENAIGFVAWCYDIKAQKIRKQIIELNQKLLSAPSELPEDEEADEGKNGDEVDDAAQAEGDNDGGNRVEAVVDKPLTAAEIAARIEELQAQFDLYKTRATREFIAFVNRYPDSGQTPANLAKIAALYVEKKDFSTAEAWLIRLNKEYPNADAAVQARFTLGRVYIENDNYPKASETFSKMLDRLPSYPLANLVYVSSRMYIDGDPARPGLAPEIALAANREIVARAEKPEHPEQARALKHRNRAMFRMGTCLLVTEQFEEAIELFERMMRESEAAKESGGKESAYYFEILHGRGVAFRHAGRLEESSASFDKLLSEINRDRYPGQYYASLVGAGISMGASDNEETVRRSVARFMQVIQFADTDDPKIRLSVEDAYIEASRALASLGDQERAIKYKREYLAKFHDGRHRKAFNSLPPKRF